MKNDSHKNLFVISTPWQLVNAYEAKTFFDLSGGVLIIDATSNLSNIQQIKSLINTNDWDSVSFLTKHKSNFLQYVKLIKQLQRNNYAKVFVDWNWFTQVLIANITHESAYIVDDGLATVTYYRDMQARALDTRILLKKKIRFLLFGLKISTPNRVNFFTSFDLNSFGNTQVVRHHFQRIEGMYPVQDFAATNDVFIIGQALVEKGAMREEVYNQYIKSICQYFKGHSLIYIPHRDEQVIYDTIGRFDNLVLKVIEQPVEVFLLKNKLKPIVVGLFSSSLVNVAALFQDLNSVYYVDVAESHLESGPYQDTLLNNKAYIVAVGIKRL